MIKPFNHWSIEMLDSFEELWEYYILYFSDELTDYLAYTIKEIEWLYEIMKEL